MVAIKKQNSALQSGHVPGLFPFHTSDARIPGMSRRIFACQTGIFIWFFVASQCAGQTFPGLQLVRSDPDSGRPILVATPCAEPTEFGEQTWVAPVLVYEDLLTDIFVDKNCIIAAVQTGYEQNGKYMVAMYTHYKSTEYPCKIVLEDTLKSMSEAERREFQSKYAEEYQRKCKLMGYKVRWVDVDTRGKKMVVTRAVILDIKGFHALDQKGKKDWTLFTELQKDPLARPTLTAIEHTTTLVDKELEYWKYRYGLK
jgi:hypothetical protein